MGIEQNRVEGRIEYGAFGPLHGDLLLHTHDVHLTGNNPDLSGDNGDDTLTECGGPDVYVFKRHFSGRDTATKLTAKDRNEPALTHPECAARPSVLFHEATLEDLLLDRFIF